MHIMGSPAKAVRWISGVLSPAFVLFAGVILDFADLLDIAWPWGVVLLFIVAGATVGLLWRSFWSVAYVAGLGLTWVILSLAFAGDSDDPLVRSAVLTSAAITVLPAGVGAAAAALLRRQSVEPPC